jgi:hypothetical protein
MARTPSFSSFCAAAAALPLLVLVAAATGASAFVPPAPVGGNKPAPSTTKMDVARLDLYPGLKVID